MENVPSSAIFLTAGVVITALFLAFAFNMAHTGRDMGNSSINAKERAVNVITDGEASQYVGRELTGSQIYDLIRDWYDLSLTLRVEVPGDKFLTFDSTDDLATELKNAKDHIPATAIYKGSVINNMYNDVIGIEFDFS